MTLHYHGTPITPRAALHQLEGRHFCISYANREDEDWFLANAQSVMWDNGAFTLHQKRGGNVEDWSGYYAWLEPKLSPIHWAVIPDVIEGSVAQQRILRGQWPFPTALGAPVWHLALPINYLLELADSFPRICFGSSKQYWQVMSPQWRWRVDQAFDALSQRHRHLPWVHMLRGGAACGKHWPFSSVDSTNIAMSHKRNNETIVEFADRLDRVQCPAQWGGAAEIMLFEEETAQP